MISKFIRVLFLCLSASALLSCQQNRIKCQTSNEPGIGLIVHDAATSENISCESTAYFTKGIKQYGGIVYWICDGDSQLGLVNEGVYSISVYSNGYIGKIVDDIHVSGNKESECGHIVTNYVVVDLEPVTSTIGVKN